MNETQKHIRTVAEVMADGKRPSVLNIGCPKCAAAPGEACEYDGTMGSYPSHMARIDALRHAVDDVIVAKARVR